MLGNWAEGTGNVSINCVSDCPAFFSIPSSGIFPSADSSTAAIDSLTGGSSTGGDSIDSLLNTLFNAFAAITPTFNQESMTTGEAAGIELPTNTMSPLAPETNPQMTPRLRHLKQFLQWARDNKRTREHPADPCRGQRAHGGVVQPGIGFRRHRS
jgi:hypothetical protein